MSEYKGLINEGSTCYLNSLLQTLFMTPEFRENVYQYVYMVYNADMIKRKYQLGTVYPINCRNFLSCWRLPQKQSEPRGYLKVFNGIKWILFNNMMCSNFVGSCSKLFKKPLRVQIGLKNFIQV